MIYKELIDIFRQGIFQVGVLAIVVLMLGAVAINNQYQQVVSEQIKAANEAARSRWENQGVKNQHVAAHFGMYLFKPSSDLAWWDPGVEKFQGTAIYTEAHKRNQALFKAVQDSPALGLWGELTPAFVMMVLMPLLAIWMSFGQITQEKSNGTYRLAMSQGIHPLRWMSSKALAVWLAMLLLVVPTFLIGGWLVSEKGGIPFFNLRGVLLLGSYLLYLGIFIHLSLGLSARMNKSNLVLVLMLGFWVISLWIVPKLGTQLANQLYPTPNDKAFHDAIIADIEREGIPSHAPPNQRKLEAIQAMLNEYGVDSVEALPVNFNGLRLQASEEANAPILDQHYQRIYDLYHHQEQVYDISGLLSPFILIRRLSMGLCQTDQWTHIAFIEACESYRRKYVKILNDDIVKTGEAGVSWNVKADNQMWESIPKFDHTLPSIQTFFVYYGTSMALLGTWFLVAFVFWILGAKRQQI